MDVAIGVEGLGFDSRAGQSGHSVTNGPPPLQHSSKLRCPDRGDGPRLSLHVSAQQRSWFTLRDQAGVDLIKAMLCNFLIVCKSVPSTLNTSLMRHGSSIMTYALPQDAQRGRLSRQEFVKLFEAIFPESDAVEFANHVFRTFDVNKDGIWCHRIFGSKKIDGLSLGVLNFREFVIGLSLSLRGSFDEKLYWAFKVYDVDGNGFISQSEMREIIAVSRVFDSQPYEKQRKFEDDQQTKMWLREKKHPLWRAHVRCRKGGQRSPRVSAMFGVASSIPIWNRSHFARLLLQCSKVMT